MKVRQPTYQRLYDDLRKAGLPEESRAKQRLSIDRFPRPATLKMTLARYALGPE